MEGNERVGFDDIEENVLFDDKFIRVAAIADLKSLILQKERDTFFWYNLASAFGRFKQRIDEKIKAVYEEKDELIKSLSDQQKQIIEKYYNAEINEYDIDILSNLSLSRVLSGMKASMWPLREVRRRMKKRLMKRLLLKKNEREIYDYFYHYLNFTGFMIYSVFRDMVEKTGFMFEELERKTKKDFKEYFIGLLKTVTWMVRERNSKYKHHTKYKSFPRIITLMKKECSGLEIDLQTTFSPLEKWLIDAGRKLLLLKEFKRRVKEERAKLERSLMLTAIFEKMNISAKQCY
jgi:hypothetical protein